MDSICYLQRFVMCPFILDFEFHDLYPMLSVLVGERSYLFDIFKYLYSAFHVEIGVDTSRINYLTIFFDTGLIVTDLNQINEELNSNVCKFVSSCISVCQREGIQFGALCCSASILHISSIHDIS